MKLLKKRNILPDTLWTESFTYWWIVSLATVFLFDIFWMLQTTFRPMSYFAFYPVLFLCGFFLALPSLIWKNGIVQSLWLLFFDTLFIANLMYCRTYYNAIPLHSYGLAGNLADFQASVTDSFRWYFIFLPILTLVAFTFYVFNPKIKRTLPGPLPYFITVLVLAIVVWIGDAWRGGIMKRMDFMANYAYLSSSITPIYSLAGFLWHDYYKTTEKLTPDKEAIVKKWLSNHESERVSYWNDTIREKRKVPKNLVLILCESLESWVLEKKIEGKELTPNLNRWISAPTTFYAPNVKTQVGSGRSIDAQLLILTGLMPMQSRAYAYDAVENYFYSIPKALKNDRGSKIYLLTCDKPYVWNQALVAKAFGVDSLIYAKDFNIDETAGPSHRLSDGSFMKQIAEKLNDGKLWKEGTPEMIMAVTYSGHNPFNLPNHLRNIDFEGPYPEIIKNYMITANYTDASLKSLIDYLQTREDWEETMVVITGDHEGLASDRRTAMANKESAKFVDSGQHTPLIILNSPIGGRDDREIMQTDIYATILDLMGLAKYPWKGLGYSAFDPKNPHEEADSARVVSDIILKFNLLNPPK